ncbi:MAG: S-layer homology domain-containing protein [Schwartzia succinivorans]|nr:S-layer homology domain-containing protein [Schwartzia succinivorans]
MKKTLVSALTTALVVGAASTTFAAANPFEDVPADHWAYDAIAQLAADGVIEGYGDGTYRGDQEITRYEMAQMIARAMAKGGGDKALIDKLAAEFADELNNLGVRVAALEKKVDNVKWQGMIRYRYITRHEENEPDRTGKYGAHRNVNGLLLRLEPQMQINKNWTGYARIDYNRDRGMDDAANHVDTKIDRIYVVGKYSNVKITLGKFNVKTAADYGTTMNDRIAGAEAVIGKDVQVAVRGGRYNLTNNSAFAHGGSSSGPSATAHYGYQWGDTAADTVGGSETVSYVGLEVYNDRAKKFTWGLGWQHLRGLCNYDNPRNSNLIAIGDNVNIFNLGLGYKFDKNVSLTGAYAFTTGLKDAPDGSRAFDESKFKYSYAFQLNYKGAKQDKPRSWGAFLAYRHLGDVSVIHPDARENGPQNGGEKGMEIGVNYAFAKNIVGKAQYFSGSEIYSGNNVNAVWTELGFYF